MHSTAQHSRLSLVEDMFESEMEVSIVIIVIIVIIHAGIFFFLRLSSLLDLT